MTTNKNDVSCCGKTETTTTITETKYGNAMCEMPQGTMQYIGARYIPKFSNPIVWDKTRAYEHIEVVQHDGFTYVSKMAVPAGVDITNEDYWLLWADPNAQMEELRQLVESFDSRITETEDDVALYRRANRKELNGALIGHRGVYGSAPGNTDISFNLAGQWGYTHVEADIRRTLDGTYICHHGENMNESTDTNMSINDSNYSQIAALNITKGNNVSRFETQHVSTLDSFLTICKKFGMVPVLDLKGDSLTEEIHIKEIIDIVAKHGFYKNMVAFSNNINCVHWTRKYNKYAVVLYAGFTVASTTLQLCLDNDIDGISIRYDGLTQQIIENYHSNNLIVGAWWLEPAGSAEKMQNIGVDYLLINDACDLLRPVSTINGYYPYGRGSYVSAYNGMIPTATKHDEECATAGKFCTYIYRNPLKPNNGIYGMVARGGANLAYCGMAPRLLKAGSKIRVKQNNYYKYSFEATSTLHTNFNSTGWTTAENKDQTYYVPSLGTYYSVVSITVATIENQTYNSELFFEDAAQYIEFIGDTELVFSSTSTTQPQDVLTLNRTRWRSNIHSLVPRNYAFPLNKLSEIADISFMFYDENLNYINASGWITSETNGYNTANNTYTCPWENARYFLLAFRGHNNAYATWDNVKASIDMMNFNLYSLNN